MTDARDGYSVLMSLTTREEAEVAVAALRADGVGAFLGNDHHAAAMPFQMQAMGGMQVMVPTAQLDAAKAQPQRRDRWKARLLAVVIVVPLAFGLFVLGSAFVAGGLERWGGLFKQLFGG